MQRTLDVFLTGNVHRVIELHDEQQQINNQLMGVGLEHRSGRSLTGRPRRPRFVGFVDVPNKIRSGDGNKYLRVWRDLDVIPRGNSLRAVARRLAVSGVEISTQCATVSTRGRTCYVPGVFRRCTETGTFRAWNVVVLEYVGTSTLSWGEL